jgi:hypothetical protein
MLLRSGIRRQVKSLQSIYAHGLLRIAVCTPGMAPSTPCQLAREVLERPVSTHTSAYFGWIIRFNSRKCSIARSVIWVIACAWDLRTISANSFMSARTL